MILSLQDRLTQAAFLIQPSFALADGKHPIIPLSLWELGIPLAPNAFLTLRLANGLTHLIVACRPALLDAYGEGLAIGLPDGFSVVGFRQHQSLAFFLDSVGVYATLPITGLWVPEDHPERVRLLLDAATTGWR